MSQKMHVPGRGGGQNVKKENTTPTKDKGPNKSVPKREDGHQNPNKSQHQRNDRHQHHRNPNYHGKSEGKSGDGPGRRPFVTDDKDESRDGEVQQHNAVKEERKFTGRCRLFIGNLPPETSESEFRDLFKPFGELSEVYVNNGRNFGFIRLDFRHNAEAAKSALDGQSRKGRTLRVRFATHGAALKVKNLSPTVSNELLEKAFSIFGELERAVVICDDRGKSVGEGIVEFVKKPAAMQAYKRISDGVFLITNTARPVTVEALEQRDEEDGLPDKYIPRNEQFKKERDIEPHFAPPGTFEYDLGQRWKQLEEHERQKHELVKKDMEEGKMKLDDEMQNAIFEHEAEVIRQGLMRQQEELRKLEERRQQEQMRRQQEREMRRMEDDRMMQQQYAPVPDDRRRQEMMRQEEMRRPLPPQRGRPEEMMMGGGNIRENSRPGRGGAPPLPPPPAPPAGMGIDRQGNQMQPPFEGPPQGNINNGPPEPERPPPGQNEKPPMMGHPPGEFAEGSFGPPGPMGADPGPMGGMPNQGGMFNNQGNMGGPAVRQERPALMERRREGAPMSREEFGEMKRMRRF